MNGMNVPSAPIVYSADQALTWSILSRRSGRPALGHPSKFNVMRFSGSTCGAGFIPHFIVNIERLYFPFLTVSKYFRHRRARWVQKEFQSCKSVIDLGGSPATWEGLTFADRITIVNLQERPPDKALNSKSHYVRANALLTPFRDQEFDLAFANSVIEHVGETKQQETFASEMLRVGKRVYCQTPNRWFPVEPHYLALLVHWLPRAYFTYFVHRYMTVHGLITKPSREKHERVKAGIRLLNRRELQRLFPGCKIKTERFLCIPKSYAAYR